MALTAEQLKERLTRIGGSDAKRIVAGDWRNLWLEKTSRAEPEDLSWVLPVQIGIVTEPVNLAFFEHATGHSVFGQGEVYVHPDHPFIACTIDGLTLIGRTPAIVQCKHVNAFAKIDEVEQNYYPQVSHEMLVTGASQAFLSVFVGTLKHEIVEIHRDRAYVARLLEMESEFWSYVETDTPPPILHQEEELAIPVKPSEWKTVDFAGSNSWASAAADWLENKDQASKFDKASNNIKKLILADVGIAFGAGIIAKRSKNGAITIRKHAE